LLSAPLDGLPGIRDPLLSEKEVLPFSALSTPQSFTIYAGIALC